MISIISRLSLSQRIFLAFGTAVVSAAGVGLYLLFAVQQLTATAAEEQRITQVARHAYELRIEALRAILYLHEFRESRDLDLLQKMETARSEAGLKRQQLRALVRLPEVIEALNRYEALLPEGIAAADALVAQIHAGQENGAISGTLNRVNQLDGAARALLRAIVEREQRELDRILNEGQRRRDRLLRNVLIAGLAVVALLMALLYSVIAGGVTRRLNRLSGMARQIASGDYSPQAIIEGSDEISQLAQEFNTMAGKLAEFDKVKEEFVALASHQLRTPASAVKGNLGMLLEGYCGELSAEQREILNDAQACNERQLSIIDDMLWVARTEAGRLELSRGPTDLQALVNAAAADLRHVFAARQQTLNVKSLTGPVTVQIDAQKVRMVVENLLSNASKYTPEGGTIDVTIRPGYKHPEREWAVAVRDNGVGIEPQDLGRLFSKFSRIPNPLSEKVGGSGLGLYLAREIVKLHGGSIHVTSVVGQGSTFTIVLPK